MRIIRLHTNGAYLHSVAGLLQDAIRCAFPIGLPRTSATERQRAFPRLRNQRLKLSRETGSAKKNYDRARPQFRGAADVGWLRDLMSASDPKVPSYGELARRCLDHEAWPLDIQPQARSLASLYSKFDRGIEVEWLHDRPEVQVVLASVLHLPPTTLEGAVKKHVASADQQLSRWRLRDVPQARPVDLREEGLPTVFPDPLLRPGLWRKMWWQDGGHQGAELVGRWLAARALAEFAICLDETELEARLAIGTAPLMVLFWGPAAAVSSLLTLTQRPLCVVAPGPVPVGFETVTALPLDQTESALLDWVSNLMPVGNDTIPDQLPTWLRQWSADGVMLDFDTVVGLAATALQLDLTESVPLATLADRYLSHRLDQAEEAGTREAKWLRQHGLALPIGIAKNAIRGAGSAPWDIPRTKTEWLELVPDEYQRGVDADWTRVSLQRAGTPLTVAELERALRQVPPGGFRVLATLCDSHLLQEVADGKFTFHPRWFAQYLEGAAYAALLDDAPDEWGQVGLVHSRTPALLQALEKQFASGLQTALDAALELDDELSPALIVALELLVVAAGRSVLRGIELDSEQVAALVKRQAEFALEQLPVFGPPYSAEFADAPRPRLLCLTNERALWGEWIAAMWALSEQFERPQPDVPSSLNPWTLSPSLPRSGLSLIEAHLESLEQDDARVAATYSLLGRLLQHLERVRDEAGSPTGRTSLGDVTAAPVFAVAKVLRGDGWPAWQQALNLPHGVESVKALVAPEAWQYLAKTAWRTWLEKGADEVGVQLFTQTPARRQLFWPHLPDRVLQSLLDARNPLVLLVPSECMKAEWVTMYLERVPEARDLAVQYLEVIPPQAIVDEHLEVLFELLEGHALVERAMPLFQHHARAALTRLTTLLDQGRVAPASVWLAAIPPSSRAAVFAHVKKHVEQRGSTYAAFGLCRSWLAELCAARAPDWMEAYPLLEECERRLRRVTRAFPSAEPSASE